MGIFDDLLGKTASKAANAAAADIAEKLLEKSIPEPNSECKASRK
jgi:hypothetical protein